MGSNPTLSAKRKKPLQVIDLQGFFLLLPGWCDALQGCALPFGGNACVVRYFLMVFLASGPGELGATSY
ncbi:MAG: hypothetical protein KAX68_09200 [Giesbergeria sp.]|nr:hypothetical protein [Giesbergeria sp.]